jgi:phage tail-like protein
MPKKLGEKEDTYQYNLLVSFHFQVKIPGYAEDIRFQEVGGLTAEMGVEELVVGGENRFSYKLPVRAKYNNLVLKRGVIKKSKLVDWFRNAIEDFQFAPADITVNLLNGDHEAVITWEFIQAYPVKWAVSDFNAAGNSLVIETVELAYQYFKRDDQ